MTEEEDFVGYSLAAIADIFQVPIHLINGPHQTLTIGVNSMTKPKPTPSAENTQKFYDDATRRAPPTPIEPSPHPIVAPLVAVAQNALNISKSNRLRLLSIAADIEIAFKKQVEESRPVQGPLPRPFLEWFGDNYPIEIPSQENLQVARAYLQGLFDAGENCGDMPDLILAINSIAHMASFLRVLRQYGPSIYKAPNK